MKQKISYLLIILNLNFGFTQEKKALTHKDYDLWKDLQTIQLSKNGSLIVANVVTTTQRGDGYLQIYNTKTEKNTFFHNGYKAKISDDGNYVFFLRKPDYLLTRKEKKQETKEEYHTKDDFFIYDVKKDEIFDSVPRVKHFEIPENYTGWAFIEKYKDLKPEEKFNTKNHKKINLTATSNLASQAAYALVYNLNEKSTDTIHRIKSFKLSNDTEALFFSTTKGDKKGDIGIYYYSFTNREHVPIDTGRFVYKNLAIDPQGKQLAYISARDSTGTDSLNFELFHYKAGNLKQIVPTSEENLQENWELSTAHEPFFSQDGNRLFFHSRPSREFQIDTTLLKEEIPNVDIWNYKDKLIQPEQKARLTELENRAYLSFIDTENNEVIALHDDEVEFLELDEKMQHQYILGYSSSPYEIFRSWEFPWRRDYYIINTQNGKKRLAVQGATENLKLSPNGKFAVYYEIKSRDWWVLDLEKNIKRNLTASLSVNFQNEENDIPAEPEPYGFGGFTENGEALLYDKFDIWSAKLEEVEKPLNISVLGRKNNIIFRSLRLDEENKNKASYFDNNLLIQSFDNNSKTNNLYTLNSQSGRMEVLIETDDKLLSGFKLAEEKKAFVYRKENFNNYPDLYLWRSKKKPNVQITNINEQQEKFHWGNSELFSWKSYNGVQLEGIIYKPDNFTANKKYPMITYFYEKSSDYLHTYYAPQPSAAKINIPFSVSNDYIIFIPDIVYQEGKPGESAYNAVVSGVEAVQELGFVDSDNLALQGQSWGGYQVAYLITKTNKFKAAMAGAPVSNMTSAYGGIRWKTGLSRAYQYEKSQSRIGKNLWNGLDLYIENSPLFGIPAIETPLLMMHNDADGAVPYYQGIEMFMGMRRLNKPAWLLVYNDEKHFLTKTKNKLDFSIRMMQFFDHYLKGDPAPVWMTKGIPAVLKGKNLRYDLNQD